jgi:haloalkane dehalogenase
LSISVEKFRKQKFAEVNGKRMAYIDEGAGSAIVFQHGNPTSSYLWRNVTPYRAGLGRLIACDLIGMGSSEKLSNSGPYRYGYQEQREFLFGLLSMPDIDRDDFTFGSIAHRLSLVLVARLLAPMVSP